jgi:hypothetical protein
MVAYQPFVAIDIHSYFSDVIVTYIMVGHAYPGYAVGLFVTLVTDAEVCNTVTTYCPRITIGECVYITELNVLVIFVFYDFTDIDKSAFLGTEQI